MLILIHPWPYRFAVDQWFKRSNSDLKRMFEQSGVKIFRSQHGSYALNNSDIKPIPVTLNTKMNELQFGDIILFGGRKDLHRVFLEVMNDEPYQYPDETLFRWILNNKEDLYNVHYDLGERA